MGADQYLLLIVFDFKIRRLTSISCQGGPSGGSGPSLPFTNIHHQASWVFRFWEIAKSLSDQVLIEFVPFLGNSTSSTSDVPQPSTYARIRRSTRSGQSSRRSRIRRSRSRIRRNRIRTKIRRGCCWEKDRWIKGFLEWDQAVKWLSIELIWSCLWKSANYIRYFCMIETTCRSGLRNFFKRTLYAGFEFVELLDTIFNSYPREKIKIYQSENIGCNL